MFESQECGVKGRNMVPVSPLCSAKLGTNRVVPPTPFRAPGRSHQPCGGFGGGGTIHIYFSNHKRES